MKWLTIAEIAAELRVAEETVRGWCRRGELPAAKAGGQYRVSRDALDRFLNRPKGGEDKKEAYTTIVV